MIIDFHTHIFPQQIRRNREKYFSNESAFKLLYDSPKSKLIGADDMIRSMDENGVDKSVIFGFPWRTPDTFTLHNDYITAAVQRYPDRFMGFCCVDTNHRDAASETQRCLEQGLSGVGELAFYENGIDDSAVKHLSAIMEICRHKNKPVLVHTNEPVGYAYPGKSPNTLSQIYNMVKAFPENKIILAHWGGGIFFFNLLKREVKERFRNVYFDTAASPFLYDQAIYRIAVEIAGGDKILFGSDYPLISPKWYFQHLTRANVSETDKMNILGINAQKLLGAA